MHVIIVDDEPDALENLEKKLKRFNEFESIAAFTNVYLAISYAEENNVDIAFLDIEMPVMNGIMLAKRLRDINNATNIVFTTGYSEYALEAFEVLASDYLLKPINEEAIRRAITNLREPVPVNAKHSVFIQTFGNFDVLINGKPLYFSRTKSKEVLAYLVNRRGAGVSKKELATIFWADEEYNHNKQAQLQVFITEMLSSLRKAGADEIVIKNFNSISVDKSKFDCDYYEFLEGNANAVNSYMGEYMTNYSWAEFTLGELDEKNLQLSNKV